MSGDGLREGSMSGNGTILRLWCRSLGHFRRIRKGSGMLEPAAVLKQIIGCFLIPCDALGGCLER